MGGKTSKRKGRVIPAVQSDTIPVTSNTNHTDDELQNEFYEIKNIATTELKKAANKVKDVNNQDNLGELWKNIQRIKRRNRHGENIPLKYLNTCHEYHENWLNSNDIPVTLYDGNSNITEENIISVIKHIDRKIHEIFVEKTIVMQEH